MSFPDETKQPLLSNQEQALKSPSGSPYTCIHCQYSPTHRPLSVADTCRHSSGRRLLRAFAAVALVLFLFHVIAHHVKQGNNWHHRHGDDEEKDHELPFLSNTRSEDCVGSADWDYEESGPFHYAAKTSFELPASSNLLFLLARGSLSHGHVDIIDSSDVENVQVDVKVSYHYPEALDRADVCLLKPMDNQHGVGIFTPHCQGYRCRRDQLRFSFTVLLPLSSSSLIKRFETDLPLFAQKVGDLQGKVVFGSLALRSWYMPLIVESVCAEDITMRTSNSPIVGSFNTSTNLELVTSNAHIKADIGVRNDNFNQTVKLFIRTNNAPIESAVSLLSDSKIKVTSTTSDAPINLKFPSFSIDSVLHLVAETLNAPAMIQLNPAYEGTFKLMTTIFRPCLDVRKVPDPAGKDRQRKVESHSISRSFLVGSVHWVPVDDEKEQGSVSVKSSNSPVHLRLD